jgi:hypothetical protein
MQNKMHNNTHVQAWVDFFLAYGQKQALFGQHLSAQTELQRKTRALYPSLAKEYRDDMPSKIVVDSPYGTLLITIDTSREIILKIEEIENLNSSIHQKHNHTLRGLTSDQLSGLGTLIFLSIREKTTIAYQHKELGFTDIPDKTIEEFQRYIEQLTTPEMLQIINSIALAIHKNHEPA